MRTSSIIAAVFMLLTTEAQADAVKRQLYNVDDFRNALNERAAACAKTYYKSRDCWQFMQGSVPNTGQRDLEDRVQALENALENAQ